MTQFPGHDTEFYVVINEVVTGPVTGLAAVYEMNISPDTPVWYDGLDDWKPAVMAPLTRQIFESDSAFHRARLAAEQATPPGLPDTDVPPEIPSVEDTTPPAVPQQQPVQPQPVRPQPVASTQSAPYAAAAAVEAQPARPNSYLVWAIVITALCNLICGVIAIIYAVKTRNKYNKGNYTGAERCSERAQWWVAIGIVAGLVFTVAKLFVGTPF